jgi:hypothetical protein
MPVEFEVIWRYCFGMETTSAPPPKATVKIADSEIPGIEIMRPTDPGFFDVPATRFVSPNAFVIRNASNRSIVNFGVTYTGPGTHDGVTATHDSDEVRPDEAFVVDSPLPEPTRAYIQYLLFEDGTYYGPDFYADMIIETADFFELESKAKEAQQFLKVRLQKGTPFCSAEEWESRIALVEKYEAEKRRVVPFGSLTPDKRIPKIKAIIHLSTDTDER